MTLRSRDGRPWYRLIQVYSTMPLFAGAPLAYVRTVPWRDRHLYPVGVLRLDVYYRVPVLGTSGRTSMAQEFTSHELKTFDLANGHKFYRQKLASYHARLDARYQQLYEQNRDYYDHLRQSCQKYRK